MQTETITDNTWIQTFSGKKFFPLWARPGRIAQPGEINIDDIAHALSMKCRFSGHCRSFYSVAEHSVRVSRLVPPHARAWALMHDAAEAYLPDIASPIKDSIYVDLEPGMMIPFASLERLLLQAIANRFGLISDMPPEVKDADLVMLATEARDLMAPPPEPWSQIPGIEPDAGIIKPWTPDEAEHQFRCRALEVLPQIHC